MPERKVEAHIDKIPQIDDVLRAVLLAALNEAREQMEGGQDVVPFTALAVKDSLFMESVDAPTVEECYDKARHTVQNARGGSAYALCYDGYVDTDAGTQDAIIAEGGMPGQDKGFAIAYPYAVADDGAPKIDKDPVFIGEAPNFMAFTMPYTDDELAELDEDAEGEGEASASEEGEDATAAVDAKAGAGAEAEDADEGVRIDVEDEDEDAADGGAAPSEE